MYIFSPAPSHIIFFLSLVFFTDVLIGVHCTHGVNRTGYLICRYEYTYVIHDLHVL